MAFPPVRSRRLEMRDLPSETAVSQTIWHREVINSDVESTLVELRDSSTLADFYLAGGTGLGLAMGHRRSVDLDFFHRDGFREDVLLQKLQRLSRFSLLAKDLETLHAHIGAVKVSFLGYAYPVLFPFRVFDEVDVADPRDIACMKISAIASRGTKRDFIDLYAASRPYGLEQLLDLFRTKFARVNYSMVHVMKSLTYFEDAEKDPMPDMLAPLTWGEVKNFFATEGPRVL